MEKRGRRRIPEMDKRRTKVKCETCRFVQDVEEGIGYCPVIKMLSPVHNEKVCVHHVCRDCRDLM